MSGLMSLCRMSRWCSPPTDWGTPQAVTVTVLADDDAFDESVVLVHAAADGGYDEVAAELAVTDCQMTTLPR